MPSAPASQTIEMGALVVSGANTVSWYPHTPTRILRFGGTATTALTVASSVLTGNIVQTDGTAVSPTGAAALGTATWTVAAGALNETFYHNVQKNEGDRIVYPGERVDIVSDGGSTAGAARIFLEVEPLGYADVDMRSHVASHPGSTDLATALAGATEFDS